MSKVCFDKCPKCGSTNIEANRDIKDPFIKCKDCGYYLREGNTNHKNKPSVSINTNIELDLKNIPCDTCEKNDVCKYKNALKSLKNLDIEEPFTIEIKCKYYKSIVPLIPNYPYTPTPIPIPNPEITWGGPTCPMCGSHEVDPTFFSLSSIPTFKCAKCGHEYIWNNKYVYCTTDNTNDLMTGTTTIMTAPDSNIITPGFTATASMPKSKKGKK